jgi:transcriptional antiterminator RfaH
VVNTRPHAEARAAFHLQRQQYRIFLPRIARTVRHARRTQHVLAPLFPTYLFVNLDLSCEPWRSVNGTYGVARLLMEDEAPRPVPRGVIEMLQARMESGDDGLPVLRVGQAVRVCEGPFMDFVGTLERLDSSGRVRVLLDLLGRSVGVTLQRGALSSLS